MSSIKLTVNTVGRTKNTVLTSALAIQTAEQQNTVLTSTPSIQTADIKHISHNV